MMYGSLQMGGEEDNQTPLLISNHNRKHDGQAAADNEYFPPKNYNAETHSRRMRDLKNQKQLSSPSRRGMMGREGSVTVFSNVFDGPSRKPQSPRSKKKKKQAAGGETPVAAIDKRLPAKTPEEVETAGGGAEEGEPKGSEPSHKKKKRHSFLFSMLNPYSRRWQAVVYKSTVSTVIMADMLMFIASTDLRANTQYPHIFEAWEAAVSCIFLIDYLARLYTITERDRYGSKGPIVGRLYYAFCTFGAWIDLLAATPYFVERFTGWELPRLTILRMFRLSRILKTESYMRALDAVYRVIYYNSEILYVAALICMFLTVLTGLLLYVLRPEHDEENNFGSIAATLYLSTMMLTGQGGPDGELPWYTKSVVLLTSVFSVAIFAIPASMLTWGFEAEAERMATAAYRRAQQSPNDDSTCSSSSGGGDTTDDEYFKLIAGGGDDSDDEEESPWMKEFRNADINQDGTLSMSEMIDMMKRRQSSPELSARIDALEAKVNENCDKLDLILELLQNSKRKGR